MCICIYVDTYSMYVGTLWTKHLNASIYHSVCMYVSMYIVILAVTAS